MKVENVVANRILSRLADGVVPWRSSSHGLPHQNVATHHQYRGTNTLLTTCGGFTSPFWGTFKQWAALGGYVRKGETGTPCTFFGTYSRAGDTEGETRKCFRYYTIFNHQQVEVEEVEAPPLPPTHHVVGDTLLTGWRDAPTLQEDVTRSHPSYNMVADVVRMPVLWDVSHLAYQALYHEMIHATKHPSRLDRMVDRQMEELTAEIGAYILCTHQHLPTTLIESEVAAYIAEWTPIIEKRPELVVKAASLAQKAADYILSTASPNNGEGE